MVHIQRALAWGLPHLINGNEFFMPWLLCLYVMTFISFSISVFFLFWVFFSLFYFILFLFLSRSVCMNFNNWLYYRFDVFYFCMRMLFLLRNRCSSSSKKRREVANLCVHIEPFSSDWILDESSLRMRWLDLFLAAVLLWVGGGSRWPLEVPASQNFCGSVNCQLFSITSQN